MEALYILYNRPRFRDEDVQELVCPMYEQEIVQLLGKTYELSVVTENDIDDDKYLLSKRFSEVRPTHREQCIEIQSLHV